MGRSKKGPACPRNLEITQNNGFSITWTKAPELQYRVLVKYKKEFKECNITTTLATEYHDSSSDDPRQREICTATISPQQLHQLAAYKNKHAKVVIKLQVIDQSDEKGPRSSTYPSCQTIDGLELRLYVFQQGKTIYVRGAIDKGGDDEHYIAAPLSRCQQLIATHHSVTVHNRCRVKMIPFKNTKVNTDSFDFDIKSILSGFTATFVVRSMANKHDSERVLTLRIWDPTDKKKKTKFDIPYEQHVSADTVVDMTPSSEVTLSYMICWNEHKIAILHCKDGEEKQLYVHGSSYTSKGYKESEIQSADIDLSNTLAGYLIDPDDIITITPAQELNARKIHEGEVDVIEFAYYADGALVNPVQVLYYLSTTKTVTRGTSLLLLPARPVTPSVNHTPQNINIKIGNINEERGRKAIGLNVNDNAKVDQRNDGVNYSLC